MNRPAGCWPATGRAACPFSPLWSYLLVHSFSCWPFFFYWAFPLSVLPATHLFCCHHPCSMLWVFPFQICPGQVPMHTCSAHSVHTKLHHLSCGQYWGCVRRRQASLLAPGGCVCTHLIFVLDAGNGKVQQIVLSATSFLTPADICQLLNDMVVGAVFMEHARSVPGMHGNHFGLPVPMQLRGLIGCWMLLQ